MQTPTYSPWGAVQQSRTLLDGVFVVSTASHGGIMVHASELARFTVPLLAVSVYGGRYDEFVCFEEDCEAAAVLFELVEKGLSAETLGFDPGTSEEQMRNVLLDSLRHFSPKYLKCRGIYNPKPGANILRKV